MESPPGRDRPPVGTHRRGGEPTDNARGRARPSLDRRHVTIGRFSYTRISTTLTDAIDGGARPPVQAMIAFIDAHREVYGVEPICRMLPIAPST